MLAPNFTEINYKFKILCTSHEKQYMFVMDGWMNVQHSYYLPWRSENCRQHDSKVASLEQSLRVSLRLTQNVIFRITFLRLGWKWFELLRQSVNKSSCFTGTFTGRFTSLFCSKHETVLSPNCPNDDKQQNLPPKSETSQKIYCMIQVYTKIINNKNARMNNSHICLLLVLSFLLWAKTVLSENRTTSPAYWEC